MYDEINWQSRLIDQLGDNTGGIRGLGMIDKIYLDNSNLIYGLAKNTSNKDDIENEFLNIIPLWQLGLTY